MSKGLKQKDMSDKLGHRNVVRYNLKENGKRSFTTKEIADVSKILELTNDDIVSIFIFFNNRLNMKDN